VSGRVGKWAEPMGEFADPPVVVNGSDRAA
jgi:hypothetical protein